MGSLSAEYQRFLNALSQMGVSADVLRMANLVLQNLDYLSEVGTTRRARSSRLVPIAIRKLPSTSTEFEIHVQDDQSPRFQGRLHELVVGPFRGFMNEETFDLSKDITLVYGANGTGKSSFCEALESAMLGSILEAKAKRVEYRAYCDNLRVGTHAAPILYSKSHDQVVQPVVANEDAYRFCFIEKNRLDDFARIAARTPGDQRQLIATLFGVDQFSEFVRGFNSSLDDNLKLIGYKRIELENNRTRLAASQKIISSNPERLAQLDKAEADLANRIWNGKSYSEVCEWLLGRDDSLGRLDYVQGLLDAPPPQIYDASQAALETILNDSYAIHAQWWTSKERLNARAGEVSFKQLYSALLQLKENAIECPACGTNLDHVAENPFSRAERGLERLSELAQLQTEEETARKQLEQVLQNLHSRMQMAIHAAEIICPDEFQMARFPTLPEVPNGHWLQPWMDQGRESWSALIGLVAKVEEHNAASQEILNQRSAYTEERNRLLGYRSEIERCKTIRDSGDEALSAAKAEVEKFDRVNQKLLAEVSAEAEEIAYHQRIKRSYDSFLEFLRIYLNRLPSLLLQGLGERARDLYNAFNRDDFPGDLLHALKLPIEENSKIVIEFASEPGVPRDALVILSEGHIRCLGLAILLAKNIDQECPVVIFDDVVNAIDDEHRNGIMKTLFEGNLLDGKQIILTSHAEEFLHRIQQEIGKQRASELREFRFLPHQGEHHLRVDTSPSSKNYVLRAAEAFERDEKREALRNARPALENLTDRLWSWMGRQGDGRLELKLSGPRSTWELNNKCQKLRKSLRRRLEPSDGLNRVLTSLDVLLGINETSIEWGYLNGGTHDSQRDAEFDRAVVSSIVEAVKELDEGLSQLINRQ